MSIRRRRALGAEVLTFVERRRIGRGDYVDTGVRRRSCGWSVQPMTPEEQQRVGLLVRRRWRVIGPPEHYGATWQVEWDGLVDDGGQPLRLEVHGAIEVHSGSDGVPHNGEGIVTVLTGESSGGSIRT